MTSVAIAPAAMPTIEIRPPRLFAGSCVALSASAVMFAISGAIALAVKQQFVLSNAQVGLLLGATWGFTAGIFILGPLCDALGMRPLMAFAFACHVAGALTMIFAGGFWMLYLGLLIHNIGSGTVEAVCNPLIATIYPDRKTHKLNQFHMWFPGGIVIGGLAAFALTQAHLDYWQLKVAVVLVPAVVYGVIFWGCKFPATERVQSGVSFGRMWRETLLRPFFLVLLLSMTLTASLELGPQQWIAPVLEAGGVPGILVLVWITGLMAILRLFAAPVLHRLPNTGVLLLSSIVAGAGLLMLSFASSLWAIGVAATIFALGVCYFWPTMLGTAAERVPLGGALALALLGGTGGLFVSVVTKPVMGGIADHYVHRELTAGANQQRTLAVLTHVQSSYQRWIDSLGTSRADQVTRQDVSGALRLVDDVLAAWERNGALPAIATAKALDAAVQNGPPDSSMGAAGEAAVAKKGAELILNPAENKGGLMSFRYVAPVSLILIVIFGILYLQDRQRRPRANSGDRAFEAGVAAPTVPGA